DVFDVRYYINSKIYITFANAFLHKLISQTLFTPFFYMELTTYVCFGKTFFIKEVMLHEMDGYEIDGLRYHIHIHEFISHFLVTSFLIGTIGFHFFGSFL